MNDSRFKEIAKDYRNSLENSVKQHEIHFCAYHLVCYAEMLKTLCVSSPVKTMSVKEAIHSDAMRVSLISVESLENRIRSLDRKDVTCLVELCREICDFVDSLSRECSNSSNTAQLVSIFHIAALVVHKAVKRLFFDEVCSCREIGVDEPTARFGKELDPPIDLDDEHFEIAIEAIRLHFRRFSKR